MRLIRKMLLPSTLLLFAFVTPCFAEVSIRYTDKYIYNEFWNYEDIMHDVVKGFSFSALGPNFYTNDWDTSWTGDPLTSKPLNLIDQIGLTGAQVSYLAGLTGLQSNTLYFVDLTSMLITTSAGPLTDANAADPGFQNYLGDPVVVGAVEMPLNYVVDPLDPFNIIIEHYIITYVDQERHQYNVLGVFQESNPVPEPATLVLVGAGFAGIVVVTRRRRK